MNGTVQPLLVGSENGGTDLTVFVGEGGRSYELYLGLGLVERVSVDPAAFQRKLLVARLYNARKPVRELAAKFGHDPRTMRNWGKALQSGDMDEMASAFAGRGGGRKVTPELIRYVQQQYRSRSSLGRNYRAVIIDKVFEVFCVRISTTVASGLFRDAEEPVSPAVPEPDAQATDGHADHSPSTDVAPTVKRSPALAPMLEPDSGSAGERLIHHAGQALFIGETLGFTDPLQRQFLAQILQSAVNVEQSKALCGQSLENFTGDFLACLESQRKGLDAQASSAEVLEVYRRNAELLSDGPNRGDLFYFDPHFKEYTGQLKILLDWCGRWHAVVKGVNLDSFHTRSGRPCFVEHHSPYLDMRERFFLDLARFDKLFDPDKRRGRTFVIDRGIYGLPTLQSFGEDYVITWEKGYSGTGWDEDASAAEFTRLLTKNRSGDGKPISFVCQEGPWERDRSFRRILVRVTRPGSPEAAQLSILASHPDMSVEDIVWAISRRWLQENDFKYLKANFGIDQLTSRASCSFRERAEQFGDRPVDSPEYKKLKAKINARESELGKALVGLRKREREAGELEHERATLNTERRTLLGRGERHLEQLRAGTTPRRHDAWHDRLDTFHDRVRRFAKRLKANAKETGKLRTRIEELETEIEPLTAQLCEAVRKQSKIQLLIDGNYQLLDTRRKSMMDALRVTASNMFRNVQQRFRAILDNFRDDHFLVRMLSRCPGTLTKTPDEVRVKLWISGTIQAHRICAIEKLLREAEQQINESTVAGKRIRLELVTGPCLC